MDNELEKSSDFLFYSGDDGTIKVQIVLDNDTAWATQKGMSGIFDVEIPTINYHIKEIFSSGELRPDSTIRKNRIVQKEGNRDVNREIEFYNLDVIIAVGYRVNSYNATRFRIWATRILNEYLVKGFAMDDERLKQGRNLFGKDFFEELLERIREIRVSERRLYQKVTDIYQSCSIDYDVNSPITQTFFKTVQNKLEFAITGKTAAEIVKSIANASKPNMGLTSWKNEKKGGKILKTDVCVAKNYLTEPEIKELNRLVNQYLEYAEGMAIRRKTITMKEWADKLDAFLSFNEYNVLKNAGKISHDIAKRLAETEYSKFRVIQDHEYESDFDRVVEQITVSNHIPKESDFIKIEPPTIENEPLSDFNSKLIQTFGEKNPRVKPEIIEKSKEPFSLPKIPVKKFK